MTARNYLARLAGIKAVGFALNETLIVYSSEGLSWSKASPEALKHVASVCEIKLTPEQLEIGCNILSKYNIWEHPQTQETGAEKIFREILTAWRVPSIKHKLVESIDTYFTYFQRRAKAYPETRSVVESLCNQGIKLGVLTDVQYGMPRTFVSEDLQSAGLDRLTQSVITSVDVGVRKPNSKGFLTLAKCFGVGAEEMVYVGSDRNDIEGANNAGVHSVLIDRSQTNLDFGQRVTISTLEQLPGIIYKHLNLAV